MKLRILRSFAEIEIEAADEKSAIEQASFWSELPDVCPVCGAGVFLHFRENEGFKFYELLCQGASQHRNQLGQYKNGGLFYKARDWKERQTNGRDDGREESNGAPVDYAVRERLARAREAFKSIGVVVPVQTAGESDEAYLARLEELYRARR